MAKRNIIFNKIVFHLVDELKMEDNEAKIYAKLALVENRRKDSDDNPSTLFENENERQKTKLVPIPLLRASRNFPNVKNKKRKKKSIIGPQR